MPFDLYISRAPTWGAIRGEPAGAAKRGFFARALPRRSVAPIASEEFHAAMRGATATRKGDHVYWVRYPDGDPWFAAAWNPEGNVVLSTSYANHRYLRNFPDMFDMGLRLAGGLGAHLFEEVGEREVTDANIDSLLAPEGEYVRLQADTWRNAVEQLSTRAKGPLEYPLGPIDLVPEYLLFHVVPERPIADDSVAASLAQARPAIKVQLAQKGAWYAVDADSDNGLTKVLRRPDGKWQVWPAWGQLPFPPIAETTVAVAERLHQAVGGELRFLDRPFEESFRSDVRSRLGGLGVDFYEWTQEIANR